MLRIGFVVRTRAVISLGVVSFTWLPVSPVFALQDPPTAPTPVTLPGTTPTPTTPVVTPAIPTVTPTVTPATPTPTPPPKPLTKVALTDGFRSVWRTPADLGITVANDRALSADPTALKAALRDLAPKFRQAAENARPFLYKGEFHIRPEQPSRDLNVEASAAKIAEELSEHHSPDSGVLVLQVVNSHKEAPTLTADRLKGIDGVLGSYETITTAYSNRNTNIAIATGKIDGLLLSPGATFSLNATVGKRTLEAGFKTAHVFENAQVVEGIGGGVSQVTGTLFNAAALAGLKIVEVNPHSRPVAYLPLGRDATVAWGDKDLKFTNTTQALILIQYTFDRPTRHLRAVLWGKTVPGRQISLRPSVDERGSGRIDADLYRVTKLNGKIVSKERLFHHAYRWDPNTPNP